MTKQQIQQRLARLERLASRILNVAEHELRSHDAHDVVQALLAAAAVVAPDCMDGGTFTGIAGDAFACAVNAEVN